MSEQKTPPPCPFCGGPAELTSHTRSADGDQWKVHRFGCWSEQCHVQPGVRVKGPNGYRLKDDPESDEAAIALAIERWSTRASNSA